MILADGSLLTGRPGPENFIPFQRQTSLKIAQAGNIWTINNHKPGWITNLIGWDGDGISPEAADPGGDGIIIYVGLAPPRPKGDG